MKQPRPGSPALSRPPADAGVMAKALAALANAPPSATIPISHDFWVLDHYRRTRWRRVQAVIARGDTPDLQVRHFGNCCSGSDGDQQFRKELAKVLAGPEPEAYGRDDDDKNGL